MIMFRIFSSADPGPQLTWTAMVSYNVYEVFTGWDDDDTLINNYWIGNLSNLEIDEIKKVKKLDIQGIISENQAFNIYAAIDNSDYALLGKITGQGVYVDTRNPFTIGSEAIGTTQIGGEGDGIEAYNFEFALKLHLDKFNQIKLKFVATGVGFLSVNRYKWYDIRLKGAKILKKYRQLINILWQQYQKQPLISLLA